MSAPKCGVCHTADSKYKCPICEMRYCSIPCYKSHKSTYHPEDNNTHEASGKGVQQQPPVDRPGTTQRLPKADFDDFYTDPDLQRLLLRFPSLKHQLQLVYSATMEPGPEDAHGWSRHNWLDGERDTRRTDVHGRGRGRDRGRGRGRGRVRGGYRDREPGNLEDWQRGPWTQEKGDQYGLSFLRKMREDAGNEDLTEGMNEFVELCKIKFGG